MNLLLPAVILVGVVCAVDLLLTLGVVKRLREHSELIAANAAGASPSIGAGEPVGDFSVRDTSDEPLDRDSIPEQTLFAFLSPACEPCKAALPKLVAYGKAVGDRSRVVAVVSRVEAELLDPFVAALEPFASVVIETSSDALNSAFKVQRYPVKLVVGRDESGELVVREDNVDLDHPRAGSRQPAGTSG